MPGHAGIVGESNHQLAFFFLFPLPLHFSPLRMVYSVSLRLSNKPISVAWPDASHLTGIGVPGGVRERCTNNEDLRN